MIKKSTYIRNFSPGQFTLLEALSKEENLKTAPEVLFFALENYLDQKKEIQRLNRIIQYKQNKIEKLETTLQFFKSAANKIHELSKFLNINNDK